MRRRLTTRPRASSISKEAEKSLEEISKKRKALSFVEERPCKLPRNAESEQLHQDNSIYLEMATINMNLNPVDNVESIVTSHFIGTFLYPICEIGDTREQFLYRQPDPFHVEKLKCSILNNVVGKYFRSNIIVNIYHKSGVNKGEKELTVLHEKIKLCHKHPNKSIFYSIVRSPNFTKYFSTEVVDGNHTTMALKQILQDASITNLVKSKIGQSLEGMVHTFNCSFYFDLGYFCFFSKFEQTN